MLNNIETHRGHALVDVLTDILNSLVEEALRQTIRTSLVGVSRESYGIDVVPDGALAMIPATVHAVSGMPFQGTFDRLPRGSWTGPAR